MELMMKECIMRIQGTNAFFGFSAKYLDRSHGIY